MSIQKKVAGRGFVGNADKLCGHKRLELRIKGMRRNKRSNREADMGDMGRIADEKE